MAMGSTKVGGACVPHNFIIMGKTRLLFLAVKIMASIEHDLNTNKRLKLWFYSIINVSLILKIPHISPFSPKTKFDKRT